jgi:cathepsin L
MGHNQFSDMTQEEIDNLLPSLKRPSNFTFNSLSHLTLRPAPESLSYKSSCLSVVDQYKCGSCWAFAATAQIETHLKIKNSNFNTHISPQYLVDCAPNLGCSRFGGGWPDVGLSK